MSSAELAYSMLNVQGDIIRKTVRRHTQIALFSQAHIIMIYSFIFFASLMTAFANDSDICKDIQSDLDRLKDELRELQKFKEHANQFDRRLEKEVKELRMLLNRPDTVRGNSAVKRNKCIKIIIIKALFLEDKIFNMNANRIYGPHKWNITNDIRDTIKKFSARSTWKNKLTWNSNQLIIWYYLTDLVERIKFKSYWFQ